GAGLTGGVQRGGEGLHLLEDGAAEDLGKAGTASGEAGRELGFHGIADYGGDALEPGDFIRRALGVTSGNGYFRGGMIAMQLADGEARFGIGGGGDGAGVEHHPVGGFRAAGALPAPALKVGGEGGAVGLVGAATEVAQQESG